MGGSKNQALDRRPVCDDGGSGEDVHLKNGSVSTPAGEIPRVQTELTIRDHLGTLCVRVGIGRGSYRVTPGLYAVNSPGQGSPVFVTANYKLSFDHLRSQLAERDGWILVLDTFGINVWCAAGKGTFGTDELIHRIGAVNLAGFVSHRNLILPQLGATGVSAFLVKKQSGWRVVYGPVRAADLPAFLDGGQKATQKMRRVRFSLVDRLILIPVELVTGARYLIPAAVCLLLLAGLGAGGYSLFWVETTGLRSVLLLLLAYLAGVVVVPALLPWIPGRAFSLKGTLVGLVVAVVLFVESRSGTAVFDNRVEALAWLFLLPAVVSFVAMNFTGASTYTSLSGVRREMRFAVPVQITAAILGLVLWFAGRYI